MEKRREKPPEQPKPSDDSRRERLQKGAMLPPRNREAQGKDPLSDMPHATRTQLERDLRDAGLKMEDYVKFMGGRNG